MITSLLASNLVQLLLTAAIGAALYLVIPWNTIFIKLISYAVALGIIVSALLTIGEVNIYSNYYRRAFFYFGDEITTIIAIMLLWSLIKNQFFLSATLTSAMLLSGGKVSVILLIIATLIYFTVNRNEWDLTKAKHLSVAFLIGVIGYFTTNQIATTLAPPTSIAAKLKAVTPYKPPTYQPVRTGSCSNIQRCFSTQVKRSLQDRYFTAIAGLWMTLQGGYPGKKFPNTPQAFADLMMKEDPWGINKRYNLNHLEWKKMGLVQTPYLAFGAGYGPALLILLLITFGIISILACLNIIAGERGEASLYSIIFITIVAFNHTQSWLKSGSLILIMLGFCASHIIISWLARQQFQPFNVINKLRPAISGQTGRA